MGCRSSKAQLSTVSEPVQRHSTAFLTGVQTLDNNSHTNLHDPSPEEKRARAAEAAEARKGDWRQGGHADPQKARNIAHRREKEDLLAKIYNRYTTLGKEPPIGLPSCDLEQLRRHLETLR
ncbi:hypothetical protein PsorP6_003440 [Peronosclerospora sorghi]|uniref:Uncharacterized protein n=1 Tax=Peronosclerospora sorghi TaxID=230839 RepID=A0ACC0VMB5_9STRA|nr:hypothetical protein PsorP6_003440 [Peronosclerospora sorghi]